jgi:hypothetical protein
MTPAKLDVYIAMFAYSGNGSIPSVSSVTAKWIAHLMPKLIADDRVGKVVLRDICDTPITMTRNLAVREAKEGGFDVLLMLDSDMHPDMYVDAPPFWDKSFDFLYDRYVGMGHPTVIGAPYVGPPCDAQGRGEANPYVFRWYQREEGTENLELRFLNRNEAAEMNGIQPMAALPTGLILYTLNAFDLMEPPYFQYEMTDRFCTAKASTEDVYNTREIGLAAASLGYGDVVFANMDSWAGHMKVKTMGKPMQIDSRQVSRTFQKHYRERGDAEGGYETWFLPEQDTGGAVIKDVYETMEEEIQRIDGDQEIIPVPPGKDVDIPVRQRVIANTKLWTVGNWTPDVDIQALRDVVSFIKEALERPIQVVEIGSWVGESATAMLAEMPDRADQIFCIDTFQGNRGDWLGDVAKQVTPEFVRKMFTRNMAHYRTKVVLIEKDHREVVRGFKHSQNIDFVYIDAEHDKESVLEALRLWLPHVADDGYIGGHDLGAAFPGVGEAVLEFFAPLDVNVVGNSTVWFVSKRAFLEVQRERHGEVSGGGTADEPAGEAGQSEQAATASRP